MFPSVFSTNEYIIYNKEENFILFMLSFIPVFWRYIIKTFFKFFILSICGFISVLLITRLKEIGQFMALSSSFSSVLKFTLYQIPYILPVAIPISCLIASIILFQKMSLSNELTAYRSCGISIEKLFTPLLFSSFILFIVNVLISSELTPHCREKSKRMLFEKSSFSPIILLQRKNLSRLKKTYLDMKSISSNKAKNVLCILPNKSNNRLNLFYIEFLKHESGFLYGENVSIISHLPSSNEASFDHLILENQEKITTDAEGLSQIMKSPHWSLNPSYMPMKMLIAKIKLTSQKKSALLLLISEGSRRFSLGFAAFTFTLLGASFGIEITRTYSKKKTLIAAFLALLIFLSFSIGKAFNNFPIFAAIIYLIPQIGVILVSKIAINKIAKGIE